jgi:hypothetical protein
MGTACPAGAPTAASISAAITAATGTGPTTIRVGPSGGVPYSDGPYVLPSGITLQGSGATGAGATVISLGSNSTAQTYITGDGATIRNLRVVMDGNAANSPLDEGISVSNGSTISSVVVIGSGAITGARGLHARGSTVFDLNINLLQGPSNQAVLGEGGNIFTDSTWNAPAGYRLSPPLGLGSDTLSRVTIRGMSGSGSGVWVDSGTLNIDDAVISLGTSTGAGLKAQNPTADLTPRSIIANHLTIAGGGSGSVGVLADATLATAKQTSTVSLTNSIVRGPDTSIRAIAGNDGSQGGNSIASVTTSYTDYQDSDAPVAPNGTATSSTSTRCS